MLISCQLEEHLLRVSFTLCVQAAMPSAPLGSTVVGTTIGADPSGWALATVAKPGDCPASEFGGEPSAAVVTFTRVPQLNAPSSVGGVTMGTTWSTVALAGLGVVVVGRSSAPSN